MDHEELNGGSTPVESEENTPVDTSVEAPQNEGVEDILAALDSVDVGEDAPIEDPSGKGSKGVAEVEEELTDQAREMKAQMEAALMTGGLATGLEKVLSPVQVTEEMRTDFQQALYPVLMGHGGGVMPKWITDLLSDWKAELELAKKTVAIGWAIYEQKKDINEGKIKPEQVEKKRYRLPAEKTSRKVAA